MKETKMFAMILLQRKGHPPVIEQLFDTHEEAVEAVKFHHLWRSSHRVVPITLTFDEAMIEPPIPDDE